MATGRAKEKTKAKEISAKVEQTLIGLNLTPGPSHLPKGHPRWRGVS